MAMYPPSPTFSDCDSLASDELDALLDAQGELSHWPTPPLSGTELGDTGNSRCCLDEETDYIHIASLFVEEANADPAEVDVMSSILFRAQLPSEILALAFNIMIDQSRSSPPALVSASRGLLLAATLNLAALYTIDHPPKLTDWSNNVCDCRWTAAEIDQVSLQILSALDWRLHKFGSTDAIQRAMDRLHYPTSHRSKHFAATMSDSNWDDSEGALVPGSKLTTRPKVSCEDGAAYWVNGQLTPEGTPTEARFDCVWNASRVSVR